MKLKDDYLVSANMFDFNQDEYITVITDKGTAKRVRLNEFELLSRARRGLQIVREVKTNPYKVLKTFVVDNKEFIGIKNDDIKTIVTKEQFETNLDMEYYSTLTKKDDLEHIDIKINHTRCNGCENKCALTINLFNKKKFISGNRCERGSGNNGRMESHHAQQGSKGRNGLRKRRNRGEIPGIHAVRN